MIFWKVNGQKEWEIDYQNQSCSKRGAVTVALYYGDWGFQQCSKAPPPASGFVELNKGPTSSEEDEMHMDLLDKCQSGT